MSNFLEHLKRYEDTYVSADALRQAEKALDTKTAAYVNAVEDKKIVNNLRGKIVLDPRLDPDPYGYHGIPLSVRLSYMGWK